MIIPLLRASKKIAAKIRIGVIICLLVDGQ
jgi:hypothetical protein